MSLFSALGSAANALSAFQSALTTTQNNVTNASTPGYAKQRATLQALPFQDGTGEVGGVTAGAALSSRDQYAESNVQTATSQLGTFEQQVESLTSLQSQFDISGNSGVPAALTTLYSAFSSWSTSPNDSTARQNVITAAQTVASAFQGTAANVSQIASAADTQTSNLVDQVNTLTGKLSGYNAQIQTGRQNDPSIDAAVHTTLESLSQIANITTIKQSDGTFTVVLGNHVSLVSEALQNKLYARLSVPATPPPTNTSLLPTASLADSRGTDVTADVTSGKLAGVLNMRNQVLPSIQGSSSQTGSLNTLATGFADRVNTLVGFSLFSYDTTNVTNTANSLQVSSTATGQQLPSPRVVSLMGAVVVPSSFIITPNSNDSLNLKVDGTSWPTIKLNPADTSLTAVALDLNTKFNTLGIGASATVSANGALVVATTNTGSSGSIQISAGSANATLGLAQTTATYQSGASTALTGNSVSSAFAIAATINDGLNLKVDGTSWPTIKLNLTDTNLATVALDLNTQFGTLGIGANASVSASGTLVVATTNTGSSGSIQILAGTANTTLGLVQTTFAITTAINDSLNLKVDGTSWPIKLNTADTNLATVAADLNTQFSTFGIGANASVNASGALVLATTNTASNGSIQIMTGSANATLGLVQTTPTYGSGAAALSLANLSNPQNSADEINGQSYTAFFGSIAASVGSSLSTAQTGKSAQQDIVTQAQSLRTQLSGVDLNAEAAQVLQLQTSYQAASKMVTVVDTLMQAVIALIP